MKKLNINYMKEPNKIINYWKKEKVATIFIAIFGLAYNITMVLGPIYQGKLLDTVVARNLNSSIKTGISFISIVAMIQIFRYFKRFYIRRFANSTSASMRLIIYNNVMNESQEHLDKENIGNLMTRAISDVDLCVEGMRKFTTEVFDTGVMMITYFISMMFYDVKITLMAIVFIPVAMLLAEKLKKVIYKYSVAYRNKSGEVASITYSNIENAMLFRISGMELQNRIKYNNELEDLQNKSIKANLLENSMQPIYNSIAMIGIVMVIYMGGNKVINGVWTVGVFSAYIAMFGDLAIKASKAAKLFNSVQKSQVSWKRIKPYLAEHKEKDKFLCINDAKTLLEVDKLKFCYPTSNEYIIENISFNGRHGEIIGVTGPIASGKTTLGIALLGLYDYEGSIKIDGKELKDYSSYEISSMISYLSHKPQLLSDTIYNNITLGNKKDILEVLNHVCFNDDLKEMPEGQNTFTGNSGIRLSGGQQGRIALSRTLLNKNKIIILDDPFSAIDMKTEEKIIENLKSNYKESLIILISHRLTAFDKINKILFMHNDKTFEIGSHQELMKNSLLYKEIYNLQSALGDENEK
ncbi:MAG: ABC transporter ATP-binding protein [Sedimentibacter sp.]